MPPTVTLDFETFYAGDYTLKKATTEEYVRDSRFQPLCLGFAPSSGKAWGLIGPDRIRQWADGVRGKPFNAICHNAYFDCFILNEIYGIRPAFIFDTMSMARAVNGPLASASLENLVNLYGLPHKTVPYNKFIGKRFEDMDGPLREELLEGCLQDCRLTMELFKILVRKFPPSELEIIDTTIRMFTEPRIHGDAELFDRLAVEEEAKKQEFMDNLGLSKVDLRCNTTMIRVLEGLGESVPTKKGKAGPVPCFASSDLYMIDNRDRDDWVGLLLRARGAIGSSISETRCSRLADMSRRGPLPVYLGYNAAVTTRWGGGQKANFQNFPHGRIRKGLLANSLGTGSGFEFFTLDFSQVEYRILCGVAGQTDKLEALAAHRDLYCEFGSRLFGRKITKADDIERQFSKKIVLGCGYGTGKKKAAAVTKGSKFGGIAIETIEAAVDLYRSTHPRVVEFWRRCDSVLPILAAGGSGRLEGVPIEIRNRCIVLPNGIQCRFNLVWCGETQGWFRRTSKYSKCDEAPHKTDPASVLYEKGFTPYWGGGLTEFICQSLARVRLSDLILKAKHRLGVVPVMLVHDDFTGIAPAGDVHGIGEALLEIAREPSSWWPDGPPFDAEVCYGERYPKG